MTRAPSALARQERRLTLRARVLIAFVAAAIFLVAVNITLATLLTNTVSGALGLQLSTVAQTVLNDSAHPGSLTLRDQIGVLDLYQVVSVSIPTDSGPKLHLYGPSTGLQALAQVHHFSTNGYVDSNGWRFYRVSFAATNSHTTVVIVGASLSTVSQATQRIYLEIAIMAVTSLLILAVLTTWVISISIRPLATITDIANSIANGARGTRVNLEAYFEPTEVGAVAHAFNDVLTTLENHIAREEILNQNLNSLNNELRQFVADASHELRTPLTSITGYAQLLAGGAMSPADAAAAHERIVAEASRMRRLIEDLLRLAKLESRLGMRYEYFDLTELVTELVTDHQSVSSEYPVTVTGSPTAFIEADHDQITSAVSNLLANLRAHTPAGTSATVEIVDGDPLIHLTYTDTGPGVSDPSRLFRRFWRSPGTSSAGTGLGLAIVFGVVRAHGGTVTADSSSGAGLSVSIALPAVRPPELAEIVPDASGSPVAPSTTLASSEPSEST